MQKQLDQGCQQIVLEKFDRNGFKEYLQSQNLARPDTYICRVNRWHKSTLSADEYLAKIENANSFNNTLKAIRHYCICKSLQLPQAKLKPVHVERLIIAPTQEQVQKLLGAVDDLGVKAYLALCATTMVRCERLHKLTWAEVDFEHALVLRKVEHRRTKWYRPNPLHKDVAALLQKLYSPNARVFNFGMKKIRLAISKTGIKITPTQLRDFAYNETKKCGMNVDLRKWLMGHDIGIDAHYTSDDIIQEYSKFEQAFRIL